MDRQKKFDYLVENYSVALEISEKLIDSGLLERKIKIHSDGSNVDEVMRPLITAFASDLRVAKSNTLSRILDPFDKEKIARAYFDELELRGNEWEYAELQDLFTRLDQEAKEGIKRERDQ